MHEDVKQSDAVQSDAVQSDAVQSDAVQSDAVQSDTVQGKITISDVAEALGISKTTVSRSISGKGRIGAQTRQRVLAYIDAMQYKPNLMAKGLAQSKTYNIGWVMPGDSTVTDLPFFQRCMIGISEVAAAQDYDILISMVYNHDISQLERIVHNDKVDGIVLGRTLVEDPRVEFLKESNIPFVVIGSSLYEDVIQIDNDHICACKELMSILIMKGIRKFVLIGGDSNHMVNRIRRKGFEQGLEAHGISVEEDLIFMNNETTAEVERAVDSVLHSEAECIICMDDRICYTVLGKLRKDKVRVPDQIKIASFYNSAILGNHQPAITALQYDPKELGKVACKALFDLLEGRGCRQKRLLSYEVMLKGSTQ